MSFFIAVLTLVLPLVSTPVFANESVLDIARDDFGIERFQEVSPGIYRGGRPSKAALAKLQARYGIETIVSMDDNEEVVREEAEESAALGIEHVSVPLSGIWAPADDKVDIILNHLKESSRHPIFLHCKEGRDRTGLLIGLHRVLNESWSVAKAYSEMLEMGFRPYNIYLRRYFEARAQE